MSRQLGQSGHRYITLVRAPYPGYRVNIPCPDRLGALVSKVFCGHKKSLDCYLAAALAWRDMTYSSLYARSVPSQVSCARSGTATGVIGVRHVVKKVHRRLVSGVVQTYDMPCIVAEIRLAADPDGCGLPRARSRVFSIAKYGEEEALRRARSWRAQQELVLSTPALHAGPIALPTALVAMVRTGRADDGPAAAHSNTSIATVRDAVARRADKPFQVDANGVFDFARGLLQLRTDRELACALLVTATEISKMRRGRRPLGAMVLLRLHEATRVPTARLRALSGDRRRLYRS